jgi:hypothetical protein
VLPTMPNRLTVFYTSRLRHQGQLIGRLDRREIRIVIARKIVVL